MAKGRRATHVFPQSLRSLRSEPGSPAFYIPQDIPGNRFFFCATCGSSLYVEPGRLLDKIVIKAGSLDGPASSLRNKIDLETFTKDRVSYLCPIDGAKQETTFP